MAARGADVVEPVLAEGDAGARGPWTDPEDFNPGYLLRDLDRLPKTGPGEAWRHSQNYWADKDAFPAIDLDDPAFRYT
jgi:hypothetical protein